MDSQKASRRSKEPANVIRLHKYLARCGCGSRRACERLIGEGRVEVDGFFAREPGTCVNVATQAVKVDGERVEPEKGIAILLNKPRDILCTSADPGGRRTFHSLLPRLGARLFCVGRLDRDSEGLLLVTNDGDMAYVLTHPRHEIVKVYRAWLDRRLTGSQMSLLRNGVRVGTEILRVDNIESVESAADLFAYDIRLHEGRNRHIRRLLKAVGRDVVRLKRTALGPLKLGNLRSGAWRYLRDDEIKLLRAIVSGQALSYPKRRGQDEQD